MIAIVDYGVGNLGSIKNMLAKAGVESVMASSEADIEKADKLILPGVGAFDHAMTRLSQSGNLAALTEKVVNRRTPILGICLGAQLLCEGSEEGVLPGLGWLRARVKRLRLPAEQPQLKLPHMRWNTVQCLRLHPLFHELPAEPRFYFVHSYHLDCDNAGDVIGTTEHGVRFPSVVASGSIMAVQFHPEKSHQCGLRLLRNFVCM